MLLPKTSTRLLIASLIAFSLALSHNIKAQSNDLCLASPEWGIFITDYGYADRMVDLRQLNDLNFQGREYLSGEWAHAISYVKDSVTITPTWLEPAFLFPDWISNSNFIVVSAITQIGSNAQGLPIFSSTISNNDLEITINSEVIDTLTGIQQGNTAASASSILQVPSVSGRYLLQQQYSYKNISGVTLGNIQLYQMLHSLSALVAVYDNRNYPGVNSANGPMNFDADYNFDTSLIGKDNENGSFVDPSPCLAAPAQLQAPLADVFHIDTLTMHSAYTPIHIDSHYYGDNGSGDNHIFGQPYIGSHLNIEAAALNDLDFFDPGDSDYPINPFSSTFGDTDVGDYWVAGAQQHILGNLSAGQTLSFTYLLSLRSNTYDFRATESVAIPILAPWLLLAVFIYLRQLTTKPAV